MRILYLPNSYSQQRQREKKANIYPVLLAMQAEWYRKQGHEVYWGITKDTPSWEERAYHKVIEQPENLPFLTLPRPDRIFTYAKSYTSGNYKYLPGTHIMSASGCWWGKCSFCVENEEVFQYKVMNTKNSVALTKTPNFHKPYEVRPVEDVISEIEECKSLGFREIFDDSATFPTGRWLDEFIRSLGRSKIPVKFSCNMRVVDIDFSSMRNSNFRMLLFGIESANQYTLDRISKGVKVEDIIPTIKKAYEAGLEPHISCMLGYPWETDKDSRNTIRLVHFLLRKGYAKTAQASFYCPPDGKNNESQRRFVKKIYNVGFDPRFWFRRLRDIKNMDDLKYLWRGIKSYYAKD